MCKILIIFRYKSFRLCAYCLNGRISPLSDLGDFEISRHSVYLFMSLTFSDATVVGRIKTSKHEAEEDRTNSNELTDLSNSLPTCSSSMS